jgi:hypothetical protein
MSTFGTILYGLGATAVFLIDVVSTFWLASAHGIGWAILAWITFLPLLVIPFLAGFGVIYLVALGATVAGTALRGARDI